MFYLLTYLLILLFLLGRRVNCRSQIFDMTLFFQDGVHDVHSPLTAEYAAAYAGCLLACRAHMTSLAHCVLRFLIRTYYIVHSYMFKCPFLKVTLCQVMPGP